MRARFASWFVCSALIACSSAAEDPRPDEWLASSATACKPPRLTPSNLPANICDIAGTKELNVASGTSLRIDPGGTCDALVPQGDGLPPICVLKYANVSIDGLLQLQPPLDAPRSPAVAIVATHAFSVTGTVDASGQYMDSPLRGSVGPGGSDSRGEAPADTGKGAGHVTVGGGTPGSDVGGAAFGPTTGAQLVAGSSGAQGVGLGVAWPGFPGMAGGAVQLVACGDLTLSGNVSAQGSNGFEGGMSINAPASGGGGGSGGTIVIEARHIVSSNANLLAIGGTGGAGGALYMEAPPVYVGGGRGGAAGTGSNPPEAGQSSGGLQQCGPDGCTTIYGAYGGGGGSVGRIVINVPRGESVPTIGSDPPASIGVVGTH
ncbi:hypothetical protein LVJ94_18385 [Pendulispora rubella]|uniref:Uncharacterized protein n=1 Tax=Pendulispora rubella TaxID=2741070 RepID=A0ABZ2LJ52_9BACT